MEEKIAPSGNEWIDNRTINRENQQTQNFNKIDSFS